MTEEQKLLRDVFGSSSSESESEDDKLSHLPLPSHRTVSGNEASILSSVATTNSSWNWEPIKGINGLWFCKEFLSLQQQSALLSAILNEGWFTEETHNQAMKFGDLPCWAIELSNSIRDSTSPTYYDYDLVGSEMDTINDEAFVIPSHLLWREPFFDQLIVNVYRPGFH
ncbi:hypothetical protein Dimus_005631 [Dionaea muscipula]